MKFVFHLIIKLKHLMQKKDTRYKCVLPMGIHVACFLYKLVHGVEHLHCFELFDIGKSTIHLVL
jgi:hypothetical protein